MATIQSLDYSCSGEQVKIPIAISGDVSSNHPSTLIIPGWGIRGEDRIKEIADIFANTEGFGIVHVPEMPHRLARRNPRLLLNIYPEVAEEAAAGLGEDDYHFIAHSMGTLALNDELKSLTTVVVAGLFPQVSDRESVKAQERHQMKKLAWRFGVVELATEGRRMHDSGDSFLDVMKSGVLATKDARNFVRHPLQLVRTLAVEADPAKQLIALRESGSKIGFVHGKNDPVFHFDDIAQQVPTVISGDGDPYDNVILMDAPANGHPGLFGNIGKTIARHVVSMQDRLQVS